MVSELTVGQLEEKKAGVSLKKRVDTKRLGDKVESISELETKDRSRQPGIEFEPDSQKNSLGRVCGAA